MVFFIGKKKVICLIGLIIFVSVNTFFWLILEKEIKKSGEKDFKVVLVKAEPTKSKLTSKKRKIKLTQEVILAEGILHAFEKPLIKQKLDPKVFSRDFLLALQFQESRFKEEAVSSKGAQGVFQVMPIATQAVVEYLDFLRESEGLGYTGPEEISLATAKKIGRLFKDNPRYDRAIGMAYLLSIYDKDYVTNKITNVFRGKQIKERQRLLLYSYHAGPEYRLTPSRALSSSRQYVRNIFDFMKKIKFLRHSMRNHDYTGDEQDALIAQILLESEKSKKSIIHWVKVIKTKKSIIS